MIIPVPQPTGYNQDGIARADLITVPLVVPKVPIRGINSVNRPILNQCYAMPGKQYNPAFIPLAQMPVVNTIDSSSQVIQPGSVNRLSSAALRVYIKGYTGQGA